MKMTLTSPNINSSASSTGDRPTSIDNKSISPSSSPRGSPRPSPKPQNRREHAKSDTHLTVNFNNKEKESNSSQNLKHDGSPSSQEGSICSRISGNESIQTSIELTKSESSSSTNKERKESRSKKKSSWFNSFYPTYKSRSGDFRRIFKDVPDDERLVVDYSCAMQKEILVHGRLYVTQNYLCFYANIFGWETNVSIKWKDVSSITKEKTALVIPNAVLIHTRSEKMFFTSFVARDKVYLMLFRVWQNALMDQPMLPQEMWQWVHQSYGDELGLTSDDEDYNYIVPATKEEKIAARLSVENFNREFSEHECSNPVEQVVLEELMEEKQIEMALCSGLPSDEIKNLHNSCDNHIPTDMSDTTESDDNKHSPFAVFTPLSEAPPTSPSFLDPSPLSNQSDSDDGLQMSFKSENYNLVQCTNPHDGRQLINEVLPIHIDQLFTLLFTSSKFYLDFHASRKTTDLTQTPWTHNASDAGKSRVINLTISLNQAFGPKCAQVTETQIMLPCSKAGILYSIDVDSINAGIPYADSFSVIVHYCIKKVSDHQTSISIWAQIKYRKSVWGLVKGMIEKNCWSGLEDFFNSMIKALQTEYDDMIPDIKRKTRRKRRILPPRMGPEDSAKSICSKKRSTIINPLSIFHNNVSTLIVFTVLLLLVILNVMLYYKLWSLEEAPPLSLFDLQVLKDPPKSHEEWIKLLQQQESIHTVEIQKWQRILKTAIQLLRQTEEGLIELQRSIHPSYSEKVMSVLQNNDNAEKSEEL